MKLDKVETVEQELPIVDVEEVVVNEDEPVIEEVLEVVQDTTSEVNRLIIDDNKMSLMIYQSLLAIIKNNKTHISQIDNDDILDEVLALLGEDVDVHLYYFTPDSSVILSLPNDEKPRMAISCFGFLLDINDLIGQSSSLSQYIVPLKNS